MHEPPTPPRSDAAEPVAPGLVLDIGSALKGVTMSIALQLDRRLEPHGVTHAEWKPLHELCERPRRTVAEMAEALGISPGGMTRTLDRLEEKRLVDRVRSREDRRVVTLAPTSAGRQAAAAVPEVLRHVIDLHLAGFERAERDALLDLLQRMRRNADAIARREQRG